MDFLSPGLLSNELLWVLFALFQFLMVIFVYRVFGLTGLFFWIPLATVLANIQVLKTINLLGITATLGNITYGTIFLVTDILSENHGKKAARKAVWIGFFSLLVSVVLLQFTLVFSPGAEDWAQESMVTLFSFLPRLALGSLVAFLVSQFTDINLYHLFKSLKPQAGFLWLRNNGSTWISQLLDSLVFVLVAFWGVYPTNVLLEIFVSTYLIKIVVALFDTPVLYLCRHWHVQGKIPEEQL